MTSVLVFCGSRPGHDPAFLHAATTLGKALGEGRHRLIYGGHQAGLMGAVAEATHAYGGRVLGVIPDQLDGRETPPTGIEVVRVATMHERKQRMCDEADVIIALPGGLGTLDELFEQLTWRAIDVHHKPIGLLNTGGVWQPLLGLLNHLVAVGFVDEGAAQALVVDDDPQRLLSRLVR
jgi:uncharacterized protein (TIGR00730 family)